MKTSNQTTDADAFQKASQLERTKEMVKAGRNPEVYHINVGTDKDPQTKCGCEEWSTDRLLAVSAEYARRTRLRRCKWCWGGE